jgi:Zn-dependent protease with chaperone function
MNTTFFGARSANSLLAPTRCAMAVLVFCASAFGVPTCSSLAAPSSPKDVVAGLEGKLKAGEFTFRVVPNMCAKVYVSVEGRDYHYVHKASRFFPQKSQIPGVRFTKFSFGNEVSVSAGAGRASAADVTYTPPRNYVRVEFQHQHLSKGELRLYLSTGAPIDNLDDALQILGYAFEGPGLPKQKLFVGDRKSKRLFFAGVNHLPPREDRVEFESSAEAEAQGYVRSPLSFARIPQLPYFETEYLLGLQTSAAQRTHGTLDTDDQRRKQIEAVGQRVLSRWPTTLKGYGYRFYVLDSGTPNACACPAGTIFFNRFLMDVLENDDELEAVMAHEVAHVEKRHGLRMHRAAETGALIGTILLVGANAAANSNPDTASVAVGLSGLVVQVGSAIAFAGHTRQLETEADHFAALYLLRNGKDPAILARALKKLRYYQDLLGVGDRQTSIFSSHPDLANRIALAESTSMKAYEKPPVFDGYSKSGELVATISFEAEAVHAPAGAARTLTLLAELSTTTALEKQEKVTTLTLQAGAKSVTLTNSEKTPINPLDAITVSFQVKGADATSLPTPDQIKLSLGPVQKWERRRE